MEKTPKVQSELEIARARLPQTVSKYVSYEHESRNADRTEEEKKHFGGLASNVLNFQFSNLDYTALADFRDFEREWQLQHEPVMPSGVQDSGLEQPFDMNVNKF